MMSFTILSPLAKASDLITCSSNTTVPVYANDLKTVLFESKNYEDIILFQSFRSKPVKIQENEMSKLYYEIFTFGFFQPSEIKVISNIGIETSFVRVQFPDRLYYVKNSGWVNKKFVRNINDCLGVNSVLSPGLDLTDHSKTSIIRLDNSPSKYLDKEEGMFFSKSCCLFPFKTKPTEKYTEGIQKFGSSRDNGTRTHAASDLYHSQYQPVYAIADGEILIDRAPFYLGTNATEIRHTGGFIVRYGEMASASIKPLKLGKTVKAGQLIGYIKKVNARSVKSAMLHFELYQGTAKGPLTTNKGKFQRRSDLLNPTSYLLKWESKIQ